MIQVRCPQCGTLNQVASAGPDTRVSCFSCRFVFPAMGGSLQVMYPSVVRRGSARVRHPSTLNRRVRRLIAYHSPPLRQCPAARYHRTFRETAPHLPGFHKR
jgi:ribosomal protein S27E